MGVIWCAEIGSMHKGDKSLAFEMIRQAKDAGATIAKFQFGWPESDPLRHVDFWAQDMADWCDHFDIELMASIWSLQGLETARSVGMKRYKIAHQKAADEELVVAVTGDMKETFISSSGVRWQGHDRLLYCIPEYPVYPKSFWLPPHFGADYMYWGYSDHSHGIEPCLLAVARGARYIEKHFCLDKTDLIVRDTPFSATPAEFSEMVRIGSGIARLL